MKTAILGFGTVGSGVYDVITMNRNKIIKDFGEDIEVSRILDLRSFPSHPLSDRVTTDYDSILNDDKIETVCEMMGGVSPAYEFSLAALKAGKNVVTSNKAVVAKYGPELLNEAEKNSVRYLFEASVGGGIPIIRPLENALSGNEVTEIDGILNGTCNYIMTGMQNGLFSDMNEAIKTAQKLGYAEKDPTEDVEAMDAARKICILAACLTGKLIPFESILRKGITGITKEQIKFASNEGYNTKLIARYVKSENNKLYLSVAPSKVSRNNPLAHVNDVFNAVLVKGNAVDELMFYGKGAGALPTASAVIADLCDIIRKRGQSFSNPKWVHAPEELTLSLPKVALSDITEL